jgi:hypothetical protein
VAALALVGCGSRGDARTDAGRDPAATRALIHQLEAGATHTWFVQSAFVRRLRDGRTLRDQVSELNRPPDTHLNAALGSLTGTLRGKAVDCSTAAGKPTCAADATVTPSNAGATAIRRVTDPRLRWYTVHRAGTREVLGRPAECFRVAATPRAGRLDFGLRTDLCFVAGGVPVRKVEVRKSGTDTTTATTIREAVTDADVDAFTAPFR